MANAEKAKGHGQRMKKLQNAFHLTAKYALRGVPQDEFFAYFPEGTLADNIIGTAYDGYCQCLHQARVVIETEFQEVCEENHIADKLQTLDVMCAQQGMVDGTPDPEFGRAARPTKAARRGALRAKRDEAERLASILAEVQKRETEIEALLSERTKSARELIASAASLQSQLSDFQTVAATWAHRNRTVNAL